MRLRLTIAVSVLAVATGWVAHAQPRPAIFEAECELLKTKHLAVKVLVEGKGPYRLIFDTGSPAVLLSNKIAKECSLFDPKRAKARGMMAAGQVTLKSIEVGGAKAEGVPAMVIDHPTIKAIEGLTGPIDGIVGYPFFGRFVTTVDYGALRLRFTPGTHQPGDATEAVMKAMFAGNRKVPVIASAGQWGLIVAKPAEDQEAGVSVARVLPATAAAAAGLQAGDRILTIDGRWTDSEIDCFQAAALAAVGQPVRVVYRRGGRDAVASVTPRPGL